MTRTILTLPTALSLCLVSTAAMAEPDVTVRKKKHVSPILGDVNGDCLVDAFDLTEALADYGTGDFKSDINKDGTVDDRDIDTINAVWGTTCSDRLIGDVNGNGFVNGQDLMSVLANFGTSAPASDINGDGAVNAIDIEFIEANWGMTMGQRILGDVNGDGFISVRDLTYTLAAYGTNQAAADINGDGAINDIDVDMVLARWGANASTSLPGDVNGDRIVDDIDVDLVDIHFGTAWPLADVDGDTDVDAEDLTLVLAAYGQVAAANLSGDINGDGMVNTSDNDLLLAAWGSDYGQADITGDGAVNIADLNQQLTDWGLTFGTQTTGDIDGSCLVDETDEELLLATWGTPWAPADLDQDGAVGNEDLSILLANFGEGCE